MAVLGATPQGRQPQPKPFCMWGVEKSLTPTFMLFKDLNLSRRASKGLLRTGLPFFFV